MSLVQAVANNVLNEIFGGTNYTAPGTMYLAASTTTPTSVGGNFTEPVGNNYARIPITNNTTNWPGASAGQKKNGVQIDFPEATGSWGTITYLGLFDASSGGNLICAAQMTAARAIDVGDTLSVKPNALTINL